jgi:hypothetical protein
MLGISGQPWLNRSMTSTSRSLRSSGYFLWPRLSFWRWTFGSLLLAAQGHAGPSLLVSDGVTAGGVTNLGPYLSYANNTFDEAWKVVVVGGRTKPLTGSATAPALDLSVQCTSQVFSPARDLTIIFSDTDFGPTVGTFQAVMNGHMISGTGAPVSYQTFLDPGNVSGTNVLLTSSGNVPLAGNSYSNVTVSAAARYGLYSVSQMVRIPGSALAVDSYSLSFSLVFVPAPKPILGFGSARPLSSSGMDLTLEGMIGLHYRVDASPDMLNWSPITNFTSTASLTRFLDSSAAGLNSRFYRAVTE